VLAGGKDRVYPAEHLELLADILSTGGALSEKPMGMGAARTRLPTAQPADFRAVAWRRHC
jgi:predicted Rossmann fold nucleotide-binding protein DprA/Smf involved in DNA uptake